MGSGHIFSFFYSRSYGLPKQTHSITKKYNYLIKLFGVNVSICPHTQSYSALLHFNRDEYANYALTLMLN